MKPLTSPVRTAFRALAQVRSAPAFHPKGALYDGRLVVDGTSPLPAGAWPVLVRLSKGIGTPTGVPDLLGIAVRLERPDGPIDFLCTSALGSAGLRRFVLAPAAAWGRVSLSSLMTLERDGTHVTVHVELADPSLRSPDPAAVVASLPVQAVVTVVAGDGSTVQTGSLTLVSPSTRDEEDTAFDPDLHAPPGWTLGPRWLARIRETAYVGSRRGRDVQT